jgi:tRNA(Ile)-lysidine synthase
VEARKPGAVSIITRVAQTISRHALLTPGETVVVGVSGGPDSLVLLHLLHTLGRWRLHVATLDHGLRGAAGADDTAFVRDTAAAWGLPATMGQVDVPAMAQSLRLNVEAAARQARYAFLRRVAQQIGAAKIAVGHTQDDQAETVLMHLIRGSGLDGLRGMLPAAPLDESVVLVEAIYDGRGVLQYAPTNHVPMLVRPLLDVSRAEIEAYVTENHLNPRHDTTNDDLTYARNRVRHAVLPLLADMNPNIRATLARMADALREDAALIRQMGEAALARVWQDISSDAVWLDRAAWATLARAEKRWVIRLAVMRIQADLRDLAFEHVENAVSVADRGEVGAVASLPGGLTLRVDYAALIVERVGAEIVIDAPAIRGRLKTSPPAPSPPSGEGKSSHQPPPRMERGLRGEVNLLNGSFRDLEGAPLSELSPFYAGEWVVWQFGAWQFESRPLADNDDLAAIQADPLAAALIIPPDAAITLRARRPGDRFAPRGMGGHSQKLSDTLTNMHVPAAWRDRIPLLTVNDQIAWFVAPTAAGLRGRVAEPFAVPESGAPFGQTITVLRWQRTEA